MIELVRQLKRIHVGTLLLLLASLFQGSAIAVEQAILSYGRGMNDWLIQSEDLTGADQISLGISWSTDVEWQHDLLGYSQLEYQVYWSQLSHHQNRQLLAFRPVLTFWESAAKQRDWFWQAGFGIAYFDDVILEPVVLSTRGQFATMFGWGRYLDQARQMAMVLRYNHYSNAYLKKPNPGIDMLSIDFQFNL